MNNKVIYTCTTTAIALASSALLSQPASASQTIAYSCDISSGTPAIVGTVTDENGRSDSIEILSFLPEYFSSTEVVQVCQQTANTLQSYYQNNNLGFLTYGLVEDRPSICMTELGDACNSSNILFNINENFDLDEAFENMLSSPFKEGEQFRGVLPAYTNIQPRSLLDILLNK
jgi:hypothetical protein